MANPLPGTVVPANSLVSPGGAQGVQGLQGPVGPGGMPSTDVGNLLTNGSDNKLYLPPSALDPEIWSVRLRSFNAIGNPNFEVDQRTCLTGILNTGWALDRWFQIRTGTMTAGSVGTAGLVVVPGTSFNISQYFLRTTLTGQEVSLAAADYFTLSQNVEGPLLREICSDVMSVQVLVRSSVAGLKFGVALRDAPNGTHSLTKLATIPSANTWVLLQFPNIPSFSSSGASLVTTPGNLGFYLNLTLASGATNTAPANDTWQNGNFIGAVGQDNFASKPVNSTFDIAFVQHEPGAVCSTLMDCSFGENYDGAMGCLRYYQKSYDYAVKPGTTNTSSSICFYPVTTSPTQLLGQISYKKRLAKAVSPTCYSPVTGVSPAIRDLTAGVDRGVGTIYGACESGFNAFNLTSSVVAASNIQFEYTVDTGW